MEIYAVESVNIDVLEQPLNSGYFLHLKDAENALKNHVACKEGATDVVLDLKGKLEEYTGKPLCYYLCYHKPAVYYTMRSTNNSYRRVAWIRKVTVKE